MLTLHFVRVVSLACCLGFEFCLGGWCLIRWFGCMFCPLMHSFMGFGFGLIDFTLTCALHCMGV